LPAAWCLPVELNSPWRLRTFPKQFALPSQEQAPTTTAVAGWNEEAEEEEDGSSSGLFFFSQTNKQTESKQASKQAAKISFSFFLLR